jgi:hypothetical protein
LPIKSEGIDHFFPSGAPHSIRRTTGEPMDFVEPMELNDEGLIQQHAVYWGVAWGECDAK